NVGHIHTCTLRALVELGEYYNFNVIKKYGLKMPYPNPFVRIVDKILSRLPQLSTRYLVLFRKE
ncbi:MAG: hypothetical protein KQA36_03045, partial [Candidatus Aenigmarchaeota archaeon]|nr:hypothetical protein [Candidatus Aenigmarchaeota archaeon]